MRNQELGREARSRGPLPLPWPGARLASTLLTVVVLGTLTPAVGIAAGTPAATVPPAPPSALGNVLVSWLAVSPAYAHTGTVAAVASQLNCRASCVGLWVSRDGGATWRRTASQSWEPSRLSIAVDGQGNETFYGASSKALARSQDYGETWQSAGTGGTATVLPTYAQDQTVAVAESGGPDDYVLKGVTPTVVTGSNGDAIDAEFMVSPEFPRGGSYDPALLAAVDPKTRAPLVLHCSADLTCGRPTVLTTQTGTGLQGQAISTVLYASSDYAERGSVFAVTTMGIEKSTDGGSTFTMLNIAPMAGATATTTPMLALSPGYREAGPVRSAYAAIFQAFGTQSQNGHAGGGIYKTVDGGLTWTPVVTDGPFNGGAQAVAEAGDGRLFAGYYDNQGHAGLLCSTDGGSNWQAACPPVGDKPVAANSGPSTSRSCTSSTCSAAPVHNGSSTAKGGGPAGQQTGGGGGSAAPARGASAGISQSSHTGTYGALAAALAMGLAVVVLGLVRRRLRRRAPIDQS